MFRWKRNFLNLKKKITLEVCVQKMYAMKRKTFYTPNQLLFVFICLRMKFHIAVFVNMANIIYKISKIYRFPSYIDI